MVGSVEPGDVDGGDEARQIGGDDAEGRDGVEGSGPLPVRDGSGAYERSPDGVWRRVASGSVVVGAVDVRLGDLYDPPVVEVGGVPHRRVARAWARRLPDHPLAWVFTHTEVGSRAPIDVPAEVWEARAVEVVGLVAPELHPVNLVGIETAAAIAGIDASTVRAYVSRRRFPAPTTRVGGSPAWARAVIEDWARARRPYRRAGRDGPEVRAGTDGGWPDGR